MRRRIFVVLASLIVIGTSVGVVVARESSTHAPSKINGFGLENKTLSANETRLLSQHVERANRSAASNPSMVAAELGLQEGRVLLDGEDVRIAAAPTSTGGVCFITSRDGTPVSSSCTREFTDTGISPVITTSDTGTKIVGLTSNAVDAVRVELAGNQESEVVLGTNAFSWSGSARPSAIVVTIDGVDQRMKLGELPSVAQ